MNKRLMLSAHEIDCSRLTLMTHFKERGLPCRWSVEKNDYEIDTTQVTDVWTWDSKCGMMKYVEWKTITPLGDTHG